MVKFLTDEWATAVKSALNGSDSFQNASKGVNLCIQQVITDVPDKGEAKYWVKIDDGSFDAANGETETPDVTITQSYDTAVAMNKAELNAQAAFMQGKLKVSGNMGKLLQHQGVLQAMTPVLTSVSAEY